MLKKNWLTNGVIDGHSVPTIRLNAIVLVLNC
jgi:hypothetical protein